VNEGLKAALSCENFEQDLTCRAYADARRARLMACSKASATRAAGIGFREYTGS
jgi:hypothetical protein